MKRLLTLREVQRATDDDPLLMWAAQGMDPDKDIQAWAAGSAVAVYSPGLAFKNRIAVKGPVDDVHHLVEHVRDSGTYGNPERLLGNEKLIKELGGRIPDVYFRESTGFLTVTKLRFRPRAMSRVRWLLPEHFSQVEQLLDAQLPGSYAHPKKPGWLRWAGIFNDEELVSVAGEAFSAPMPGPGFISGVATKPGWKRRGFSAEVCSFLTSAVIRDSGRASLWIDPQKRAPFQLYRSLGYDLRAVASAGLAPR